METHREFEKLATDYLGVHPDVAHEWRRIKDRISRDRTDLVCAPGTDKEVFATLRNTAIAVGSERDHVDFEVFGRGLAQLELAKEALEYFAELQRNTGWLRSMKPNQSAECALAAQAPDWPTAGRLPRRQVSKDLWLRDYLWKAIGLRCEIST